MDLHLRDLSEEMAKEIPEWKYPGEYVVYNYPTWETALDKGFGITKQDIREKEFLSLVDKNGRFCGYIRLKEREGDIIIGLGLKPSFCGKGLGNQVMKLLIEESQRRYSNKPIRLEVRTFNKRAITSYERTGFKKIATIAKDTKMGKDEFLIMTYKD